VPEQALVNENEWVIYQLNDLNGTISKLENYKNLPEDNNLLNTSINDINDDYILLRQIEKR